jgi:hypothetical protein
MEENPQLMLSFVVDVCGEGVHLEKTRKSIKGFRVKSKHWCLMVIQDADVGISL